MHDIKDNAELNEVTRDAAVDRRRRLARVRKLRWRQRQRAGGQETSQADDLELAACISDVAELVGRVREDIRKGHAQRARLEHPRSGECRDDERS